MQSKGEFNNEKSASNSTRIEQLLSLSLSLSLCVVVFCPKSRPDTTPQQPTNPCISISCSFFLSLVDIFHFIMKSVIALLQTKDKQTNESHGLATRCYTGYSQEAGSVMDLRLGPRSLSLRRQNFRGDNILEAAKFKERFQFKN